MSRSVGVWMSVVGITGLAVAGCASSPDTADPGSPGMRPPDCELVEAGTFSVRRVSERQSLQDLIGQYGYDATKDVTADYEMIELSPGNERRVIVGWTGIGLRWNDPACRAP